MLTHLHVSWGALGSAPLESEEQVFILQYELQMEWKIFLKYSIYMCVLGRAFWFYSISDMFLQMQEAKQVKQKAVENHYRHE